jgi:small subunit ribosomal protein S25e
MPPKKPTPPKKTDKGNSSGGKKATKKWSKGKTRDALENNVLWEKATIAKLETDVPKYKVITGPVVSDRLKISVALANTGLKHLLTKGLIRTVSVSSNGYRIYTRAVAATAEEEKKADAKKK